MRNSITTVFLGILSVAGSLSAQPTVGGLLNNYSYIRPGLPNYGIAQGSIFDIFGTNLASTTASQGVPLLTTLAGTSISVTVGGKTTQALPYFVSGGQIAAILPSATPVGTGTITVTSGGQTSVAAPIVVVQSAFGLLTVAASGSGAAAAYNYSEGNVLLTQANAANPGEYLVLWGSGLGPAPGDETVLQSPADLTSIPIEVTIGGVSATVSYHGRSAYPGLDQINVVVPPGVSGCSVSLVVVANNVPSNYSTIPVAATGRTCSDPLTSPFSTSDWQTLSSLPTANLGLIALGKTTTTTLPTTIFGVTTPGTTTTEDFAEAFFIRYTSAELTSAGFGTTTSLGSCVVTTFSGTDTGSTGGVLTNTPLDAGPQINLNGPDGVLALTKQNGFYLEDFSKPPLPAIIPPTGGIFNFDNGAGGADVKGFTTSLNQSQTNPLTWTNAASITSVTRSQGVTLQWTGGVAGSFVEIVGSSFTIDASSNSLGATFTCTAPVSAGQFTVPASVLDSIPASNSVSGFSIPGSLAILNYVTPQKFTATGLDIGLVEFFVESDVEVPYI